MRNSDDNTLPEAPPTSSGDKGLLPAIGKKLANVYTQATNAVGGFPMSPIVTRTRARRGRQSIQSRPSTSQPPLLRGGRARPETRTPEELEAEGVGPNSLAHARPGPHYSPGGPGATLSDEESLQRAASEIAKQTRETLDEQYHRAHQQMVAAGPSRGEARRETTASSRGVTPSPGDLAEEVAKFSLDHRGLSQDSFQAEIAVAAPQKTSIVGAPTPGPTRYAVAGDLKSTETVPISYIDRVVPNLRDISIPSGIHNMEPGRIYRAARPFSTNLNELCDIYVNTLRIQTVIDLRDDDLTAFPTESDTRLALGQFFRAYGVTAARPKQPSPMIVPRGRGPGVPGTREPTERGGVSELDHHMARLSQLYPNWSPEVINEVATSSELQPLKRIFMNAPRSEKKLFVINLFDCPAVKKRIMETVTTSPYLPVLLAAKAADKLAGTALAPYWFCRLIMSTQSLFDSYVEMLTNCGAEFAIALKSIALAPWPILFHCSLGKDRTGCLSMMVLHVLGAHPSGIIFDYSLTQMSMNQAYQDYVKRFTCVLYGLPEEFCGSPVETMGQLVEWLKREYGGIDGYLDKIGFNEHWRSQMRRRYLDLTHPQ